MKACTASIRIRTPYARELSLALTPDNLQAPKGIEVECEPEEEYLVCRVSVVCPEALGVLRLRNTIDDLLSNIKAALDALECSVKGGSGDFNSIKPP